MQKIIALFAMVFLFWSVQGFGFDANRKFNVTLAKVNSNGTTTDIETKTVTSDSNGKISFAFAASSVPTVDVDGINFVVLTVKTEGGVTVRQSLAPAPCSGNVTEVGVNGLSDVQSKAILDGLASAGTSDPIYASFGYMLLQSSKISATDRALITACGKTAILGSGGMVEHLQNTCGASASVLNTFRSKIVCNSSSGTADLADYSSNFKSAVDNDDKTLMTEAGGAIADVFVDAWNSAGRNDLACILAAFEAAGGKTESDSNCTSISSASSTIVDEAIKAFFQRIAGVKVRREYNAALTALNASGDQVTRFNSAVTTFLSCMTAIFDQYSDKFENQTISSADQTAMSAAFQTCFNNYTTNIRSTTAEISTVKTSFASAVGLSVNDANLANFGSGRDLNGAAANWPIPELVQHSWLSSILNAGGSLTYTRDTLAIPSIMSWLAARTSYNTGSVNMNALEGLRQDVGIIQFTYFSIFAGGGTVTREQEKNAKTLLDQRLEGLVSKIGGTQNGSTAITDAQKRALIKTMLEPNFD